MARPISKENMKSLLKARGFASESDMWQKARPLNDEGAARIDALADEMEGIPRLREIDGYLLLDAGDDETVIVFLDDRATRREIIRQIAATLPKAEPENYEAAEPDYDDFQADEEVNYEEEAQYSRKRR